MPVSVPELRKRLAELTPRRLLPMLKPAAGPPRKTAHPATKEGVLGVEIAEGVLRFVEVRLVEGEAKATAHGEIEIRGGKDLAGALGRIIEEFGVVARDVHLVHSTSRASFRAHTMPEMPDRDMAGVVEAEITSEADLLGEKLMGDWCWLLRKGQDSEILIGKLPVYDREDIAGTFAEAGLRLQAMTSSSLALAQYAVTWGEVPDDSIVGLLDIGRSKLNLAFVSPERVCLVREIYQGMTGSLMSGDSPGEEQDLDSIGLGLDEIITTVQQVRRTWQRYIDANPAAKLHNVLLTGETTQIPGVEALIQNDLQVPVTAYDATKGMSPENLPDGFREVAPAFAVPWVLATTRASSLLLNLAEGVPDLRPVRKMRMAGGVLAAGVLALGLTSWSQARQLDRQRDVLAQTESRRAELEAELGVLEEVQVSWLAWIGDNLTASRLPSPDLRPHLVEIIRSLPPDTRLTNLVFGREGHTWRVRVDATPTTDELKAGHRSMEKFVSSITASPLFSEVSLKPLEVRQDRNGQKEDFEFTMQARLRVARTEATP